MNARRRTLAAGAAFLAAAFAGNASARPSKAPSENADAELIALCAEYLRIQAAFEAYLVRLGRDVEDDDPGWATLDAANDLVVRITELRASTPAGHVARLRCAAFHRLPEGYRDDPNTSPEERFQEAALRDLAYFDRVVS